jgi:uncharacterized sulfatase
MRFLSLLLSLISLNSLAAEQRPNLVLILADDLGWADLGCYGNRFNETPQLDRMAREGMRFTQFYAGPVCSPTRANIQSGQDQARFGITQHIPGHRRPFARLTDPQVPLELPLEVTTFAELLVSTGYASGYFGKWHLGGPGHGPADQGWQTALETKGHSQPPEVTGRDQPVPTAEYLTDLAIQFMKDHQQQPFVLQVSHYAVHIPLSTKPELIQKYQAKAAVEGYPCLPAYAGLMEELDESVGRILDAIDSMGLAERTLVVFVSDNGGLEHQQSGEVVTSNLPLREEKGTLYEGGIRVPAIARWKGRVPAGSVCETPAITQDLYPTFADLAQIQTDLKPQSDGLSLASLLENPATELLREALFWHLPHYHHSRPASAMRAGDWKLLEFFEDGQLELYHLGDDLGEKTNLVEQQPERARSMQQSLYDWRQKVNARMPVPNPNHDPAREMELANKPEASRKSKK